MMYCFETWRVGALCHNAQSFSATDYRLFCRSDWQIELCDFLFSEVMSLELWPDRRIKSTYSNVREQQIASILKQAEGGTTVEEVCRKADRQREQQASGRGTFVPLVLTSGEAFPFEWSEDWAIIVGKQTKLRVAYTKLSHIPGVAQCRVWNMRLMRANVCKGSMAVPNQCRV
jgi:hypothetical protein